MGMAGELVKIPARNRILMCGGGENPSNFVTNESNFDSSVMNLSDTVFEFLGDSVSPAESNGYLEMEDTDENNDEDDKEFWEKQQQLLRSTLYKTTSLESRIRTSTHESLKEVQVTRNFCCCGRRQPVTGVCRDCLMREVSTRLRTAGFNCTVSKSKWKRCDEIPAGEHTYLGVSEDGKVIVIELNFRGEFEMEKGSEEYKQLINKLPEVYVGKIQRLQSLIKILCSAAKKCMKDKKMHMGPWRRQKYMEAKWLSAAATGEKMDPATVSRWSDWTGRGRMAASSSMLTLDLVQNLPIMQLAVCAAV